MKSINSLLDELQNEFDPKKRAAIEFDIVDIALEQKVPVLINHNDEAGKFQYSVQIVGTDFWIDSFMSREEAIEFCNEEGLTVCE